MLRRTAMLSLFLGGMSIVGCAGSSSPGNARMDAATGGWDAAGTAGPADAPGSSPDATPETRAQDARSAEVVPSVDAIVAASDSPPVKVDSAVDAHATDGAAGTPDSRSPDTAPPSDSAAADTQRSPDTRPVVEASPARDTAPSDPGKPVTFATWPGGNAVANASVKSAFGVNLSGLVYQPAAGSAPAILWAVQNSPSKVYRLAWNGSAFVSTTADGWGSGKGLVYPTGSASPDSEGITRTGWDTTELYVSTEQSNGGGGSRLSILRYDLAGTSTTMTATHEWNLTADIPATDANKGLEGIAWIPDSYLVERGFYDENTKSTYDPAAYADHGAGIFLVGLESTGMVYGYALDHSAKSFKRVAAFSSGQAGVMDLAFDRETKTLFSQCDSVCDNRMTLFDIDTALGSATKGRFVLRATLPPPTTLPNTNNEGISMAPESECANNRKGFFWADDDESNGYAIRRDTIPCGRLF